jgi:hypothetical protein
VRVLAFAAAAFLLAPGPEVNVLGIAVPIVDAIGIGLFGILVTANVGAARRRGAQAAAAREIPL